MKKFFDFVLATFGLLLVWPFLAVAALLIKLEDGGPVFFRQVRVGLDGQPFRIWKFRTMVPNADRLGMSITVGRDPRITRIGHWLRKFKVDELPQLFNILAGEMSFVGPRPEVPAYVALYSADQQNVLRLMPGITDPASIQYYNESDVLATASDPDRLYREEIMPRKIQLNLDYARRANVVQDFFVILKTLGRVVKR